MPILRDILLFIHFVGLAALLGGCLVQLRESRPRVLSVMRDGAYTQLLTGLLLVGLAEMGTHPVNHVKVGIKLALAVAVVVLVIVNRKKEAISRGQLFGFLGLVVAAVAVAVFV